MSARRAGKPLRLAANVTALVERLGDDADPEDRPLGFVEQLHLPLRILRQLARNSGRHIGAGGGQGLPGCVAIGTFGAAFRSAGISAIANTEKVKRHNWHRRVIAAPGPSVLIDRQWMRKGRPDQSRAITASTNCLCT